MNGFLSLLTYAIGLVLFVKAIEFDKWRVLLPIHTGNSNPEHIVLVKKYADAAGPTRLSHFEHAFTASLVQVRHDHATATLWNRAQNRPIIFWTRTVAILSNQFCEGIKVVMPKFDFGWILAWCLQYRGEFSSALTAPLDPWTVRHMGPTFIDWRRRRDRNVSLIDCSPNKGVSPNNY